MNPQTAGYSGTPLARKLGIVSGSRVLARFEPENYRQLLEPLPLGVVFDVKLSQTTDVVHIFVQQRSRLTAELTKLRPSIRSNAAVWISWPKKSAKVHTDITEDTIREVALPLGFVDVKVCAVSDVWSGLKVVVRKELR